MSQWKQKAQASKYSWFSWKVSDTAVKDVEKLIQTVCYLRKEEESLTETKFQLYKQMETKTSYSLPPEEKLLSMFTTKFITCQE